MPCFLCNKNLYSIIDFGSHPPSDAFLTKEELLDTEKKYPLELCWCPKCCLLQLNYVVDPKELFCDYAYNTSTNNSLKRNFCEIMNYIKMWKNGLVPTSQLIDALGMWLSGC